MPTISTNNLSPLPDIHKLKSLLQAMAILDAIIMPEWEFRCYSFNAHWDANEMMGSMRNGEGDNFFALFNSAGCFLKGYVHDCPMAAKKSLAAQLYQSVPDAFAAAVNEPAFMTQEVTFCIWRQYTDAEWFASTDNLRAYKQSDPDGSLYLLSPLDGEPQMYITWAESYFERVIDRSVVEHIYQLQPLTDKLVHQLNPENSLELLAADIKEIGYPTQ